MNLSEIAKHLNVSAASISIVRQGKSGVSPATRRRIQLALEENGYSYRTYAVPGALLPNEESKRLTRFIRLLKFYNSGLLTDKNEGFVDDIIKNISAFARSEGYQLALNVVSKARYDDFLEEMATDDCCGMLVIATEMEREDILRLQGLKFPIVLLDTDHACLPFSKVTMGNRDIAYRSVEHLFEIGCDQVGHLRSCIRTGNLVGRGNGYNEAMLDRFGRIDENLIFQLTPGIQEASRDMLEILKSGRRVPRGLFADNDVIAIGAMQAMRQFGIKVPQDVCIVGVDNTLLSRVSSPTLSSMQISRSVLGKMAIAVLLKQINNPDFEHEHIHIPAKLIVRESSRMPQK